MTTVHSGDSEKPKFFDLITALQDLEKISILEKESSRFVVRYQTSAILESQRVWMEGQLDRWYSDLEKKFNVKIVEKRFEYNEKYSLILELEIPFGIDWIVISDDVFRQQLIDFVYQYFVRRIKKYTLPFASKRFYDILIAPMVTCKYVFANSSNRSPILEEEEIEVICSSDFKHDVKKAVEKNNGIFLGTRVESIREERYEIGYLEYQHKDIVFTGNPLFRAVNDVVYDYFNELILEPCGEKDIV